MDQAHPRQTLFPLTLGAIGVVYGDIGTSPLYTMATVFGPAGAVPMTPDNLIGAASTIFWALMMVVTLKYVLVILRADNRGEGGIMALTALAAQACGTTRRRRGLLLLLGLFGAALFYGDSVITPAMSVLSAVEGLQVVEPGLKRFVLPIAIGVLIGLFVVQRKGSSAVGKMFGPIIVVWFAVLGATGLQQIAAHPAILAALDPLRALAFLQARGGLVFAAVGAIVLALTGAEALYADMGHFGRKPIQLAWLAIVLPALTLNYLGQAALLTREPSALENPFFRLFPQGWLIPAVILATMATVIASQAVISGAFSMTRQAIQLGFLPRMQVVFTSAAQAGQIYLPRVNRVLLCAVIAAAVGFGSSAAMASAYGIAVTVTMLITTTLTFFVVRDRWALPSWLACGGIAAFFAFDLLLAASCSIKFIEGGWFPIALGLTIFTAMSTWKRGRELLIDSIRQDDPELQPFIESLAAHVAQRAPRTAVYLVANPDTVPQALMHNLKHNCVLHEQNVILSVVFEERAYVEPQEALTVAPLADGFWRIGIRYGFMNIPDVPAALARCAPQGIDFDPMRTSYFISRAVVIPARGRGMRPWRERLFAVMTRNAGSVVEFFKLPDNAVIELGTRVQI
ncbi:MAG: potassium transporter Kup [Burkholderiaceae bacterium]